MKRFRHFLAAVCALLFLAAPWAGAADSTLRVVIPPFDAARPQVTYFYRLLDLVLTKTAASDGPFVIEQYPVPISVDRSADLLRRGRDLSLMWIATSARRETELLPIRVSLLRELNNYRVFLIRKDDQDKFDKVKTVDDLRKLSAGLGSQWSDTEIMRRNGFEVVSSLKHDSLFLMLSAKRFDYFPRGLYEVWNEEKAHRDEGLAIEKNLMLYYDVPFYFFVNRANTALHDRLERGLKAALADGSFDQLMLSVPGFKRGLEEQRNSQRRLFVLDSAARAQ